MALSLNKYNCIVDSTDEEDEISSKDTEKTSTNPLTHLSNSFSSSHISNVKAVSLSDHELDAKELSSKKKKKKGNILFVQALGDYTSQLSLCCHNNRQH